MLDVHLMIERPERHVADFVQAGADSITFHAEATPHVAYTADLIREGGAGVGVAINPATPVGALAEVVDALDMALCMTVNPGWGGQPFIAHSPQKIERVRAIVGAEVAVEVDGGIDPRPRPLPGGGRERVRGRLGDLRRAGPRRGLLARSRAPSRPTERPALGGRPPARPAPVERSPASAPAGASRRRSRSRCAAAVRRRPAMSIQATNSDRRDQPAARPRRARGRAPGRPG